MHFTNKQLLRLFHRLRESLQRRGQVRRVRAFCKQTLHYERCLLYTEESSSQKQGTKRTFADVKKSSEDSSIMLQDDDCLKM